MLWNSIRLPIVEANAAGANADSPQETHYGFLRCKVNGRPIGRRLLTLRLKHP